MSEPHIRADIGEIDTMEMKYIEWRILNIFADSEDPEGYLYISPNFFTTDATWDMRLLINWRSKNSFIEIAIVTDYNATRDYSLKYFFGLKKCDGSVEELCNDTVEGITDWSSWKNLIRHSELLSKKTALAPSDILTVTCTLKWKTKISSFSEPIGLNKTEPLKLTRLEKLSANFKDLYANKETCDVVLKVQDKEFQAHRLILIARSSVFAANFKHDTLEKQTGVITIPDCDSGSFHEFLEYLYSGELAELSFSSAVNLYYTSNKYDIEEVKTLCIEYLMQCLSIENACEIAQFADKYDESQLFSQAQDFFNKNYLKILLTSGWECLMKKDFRLGNKLMTEMAKKKLKE